MSEPVRKKHKIEDENRQFKEECTTKYFMQHFNGAAICLICHESVKVMKDFNCKRHYETKYASAFDDLKGIARNNKLEQLKNGLSAQQTFFARKCKENKCFARASCKVARISWYGLTAWADDW